MNPPLCLVLALCLGACTAGTRDQNPWILDDGTPIVALDPSERSYVVLVMDPGECFTCSSTLSEWLEWRRIHPSQFHLVFTRRPSGTEQRRLMSVRLPLRGFLAAPPGGGTPTELLVADGGVVYSRTGVTSAEASSLLPLLRRNPLHALISTLPPAALTHSIPGERR
jgi:hypothetical protein